MVGPAPPAAAEPSARQSDSVVGFRQLKRASFVGLLSQILVWGSAIALWVVGSVYSPIPVSTKIAYGAHGFSVSAGAIFAINFVLIAGAAVALFSFVLTTRSFQKLAKATPPLKLDVVVSLTTVGAVGLGMFALGWAAWLGSFVAPGAGPNGDPFAYTPVLASNLADIVNLLVVIGGLLAFLGMLGIAVGSSQVGTTYEEGVVELGGALLLLPVFSVIGYVLSLIGLARGERKLGGGWTPPPPPPAPTYPSMTYPGGYAGGPPMAVPGPQGSWDSLAVVLVVTLVLLWVFIVPISFVFLAGSVRGPGGNPGGPNGTPPTSNGPSSPGSSSVVPLVLLGLGATAVLLPLAMARNRRKRQRQASQPVAPPRPPPPPAPPRAREDDPLDHLV